MFEPTIDLLPQTLPMSPSSNYQDSYKKANTNSPLLDLIETEQKYVEDLKCLLIKVTANWSIDDLPPPDLDVMFRHIELIYKQNKKFYQKLNKIEADQSLTTNLEDTLMGWISDMNDPYTKYIENFTLGFDSRPEIEENLSLQQTLNDISAEKNQPVSLEHFFDMPMKRLHYYKKFYTRLYKNAEYGISDDNLLLVANEQIDRLLELEKELKNSNKIKGVVSPVADTVASFPPIVAEDVYSVIVNPSVDVYQVYEGYEGFEGSVNPTVDVYQVDEEYENFEGSVNPSVDVYQVDEEYEDFEGFDEQVEQVEQDNKDNKDNTSTNSPPIKLQVTDSTVYPSITISTDDDQQDWNLEELERQLDTSKTKDLFTKLPKVVNVSLQSINLPFKREIVLHDDFTIGTTTSMNSTEMINMNVRVFLLTDLLLICQQITQESLLEKNLRLVFPPLNADYIAIEDISDGEKEILELTILQKELLIFYPKDKDVKDNWFREITKAINFTTDANIRPKSILRKSVSNPRFSMASSISISPNGLKRSPSIGNLINRDVSQSLHPVSSVSQMSSISQSSSIFPDFSNKALPPTPPNEYPDEDLSSEQGKRHISEPISSSNKLNVGLQIERNSDPISFPEKNRLGAELHTGRYERSNSITSLASVMSIATFKETIFRSSACKVFIWSKENWKLLTSKDNCIVEVRLTAQQNKGCWVILLERSNRMVLNSWVNATTTLRREDANSVSISCETGQGKEFYKVTSVDSEESDQFLNNLLKIRESVRVSKVPVKGFISRSSSLQQVVEPVREVEQTVTQIMETKCRVFLQSDHGVWTNIGWGIMKLSLETPSHRKRIIVNSDKKNTKTIIDSIIREDGVERIGKSVAVTLSNMGSNLRIIYLLKMKDEALATKVFDIMKEKRTK